MPKKILVIAGEASGDLYGAHLVSALNRKYPDARFSGVGGAYMKGAGVEILYPIDKLAIIGFFEIFSKLKVIKDLFSLLTAKVQSEPFDLAILVNYPGFNLSFARVLKKNNVSVVFYSSPQVWAWGRWRVRRIKRFVDKMIVFFKFEEDFYKKRGVKAEFVGHPLVDIVKPGDAELGIKEDKKVISLLPGSRKSEIKNLYPAMLGAASLIYSKNKDTQFLVAKYPGLPDEIYEKPLEKYKFPVKVINGNVYGCLNKSCLSITASGSATLEGAILKTPMVIIYRLSFFTGFLFLLFVRAANIGLVNILAGKRIMPELLQYNCTPKKIASQVQNILSDTKRYEQMKQDLERVNTLLGPPGASARAAEII